jgi:hypothetical protein
MLCSCLSTRSHNVYWRSARTRCLRPTKHFSYTPILRTIKSAPHRPLTYMLPTYPRSLLSNRCEEPYDLKALKLALRSVRLWGGSRPTLLRSAPIWFGL